MPDPVLGIYGDEIRRGGLPLFPHSRYALRYVNLNLSAGSNDLLMDTVPADTVRIITNCVFYFAGTAPTEFQVTFVEGGNYHQIAGKKQPVSQESYQFSTWVMTLADDTYRLIVTGATAGNDAYVWLQGYDISLLA